MLIMAGSRLKILDADQEKAGSPAQYGKTFPAGNPEELKPEVRSLRPPSILNHQ
jgi:hypothetical protein